jgi:hypothetical protein
LRRARRYQSSKRRHAHRRKTAPGACACAGAHLSTLLAEAQRLKGLGGVGCGRASSYHDERLTVATQCTCDATPERSLRSLDTHDEGKSDCSEHSGLRARSARRMAQSHAQSVSHRISNTMMGGHRASAAADLGGASSA